MWCIPPKQSAEFVCHMEDVLEVYHRPYDPKRPVVCMDETFKQLIGETRDPLPARPGSTSGGGGGGGGGGVERYDHVYTRNGVASLFMASEPLAGWRHVAATEHRCRSDWAHFIRGLLDGRYRDAERVVLVMDPSRKRFAFRRAQHPHACLALSGVPASRSQAPGRPA